MIRSFYLSVAAVATVWTAGAVAAEKTVTLAVENMSCVTCPYIVKQSLAKVQGVRKVDVSFRNKIAVVTFDDAKTNVAALTDATSRNGFPSTLKDRAN